MGQPYIHPAFPQPDDPSIILWRYMNVEKFKWLVDCGRLLMPNADRPGDPLEGTQPKGDREWWQSKVENAESEEKRRIIEHNRNLISRFAERFREDYYYVSCWHMNPVENYKMWKLYTTKPEAVAVKTTYVALKECLPSYLYLGMVRYINYETEPLPPRLNMFEYITHKDIQFSFEREVRAVASPPAVAELGLTHFNKNLFESETKSGFIAYAPQVDLKSLIHGVVLHPEAPSAFESEVIEMCTKNGLPRPDKSQRN